MYRTSDDVPVSSKVRACQLQETVKLHDSDVAPSFVVGMTTLVTSRVKNADLISGPKALREIGRFPSIATAAPKAGVSWLVDSGSESGLVFKAMLRDINAQNCRAAQHPISLITANGSTEANEVADVKLSALPDPVQPYVLNQTPAVLSVDSFVRRQVVNLFLLVLTEVVQLKVEGHVPVLDDSCKVFTKERFQKDGHLKKLFAMPTSQSSASAAREEAADEDQLDELVSDDACHEYLWRRKTEDLISEAANAQHQFTHFPKNPSCRTCQRARMMAPHARQKRIETKVFGDHIIGDHVTIRKCGRGFCIYGK